MAKNKERINTSPLTGSPEFLPKEQLLLEWMRTTIKNSYELFGFIPIDPPIIEREEVLFAKAGGETEKQIYRIDRNDSKLALRFDLTVPLARYVAEHYAALAFPFKRYHIGKVFRGERPQKYRFRELYQADIDIIGDGELSLSNDAELVAVISHTFQALGFSNYVIHISNRKILCGFLESLNLSNDSIVGVLRIIDKIEKIGVAAVVTELQLLGLDSEVVSQIVSFVSQKGSLEETLRSLELLPINNTMFKQGVFELQEVLSILPFFGVPSKNYTINLTIVRGMDYYTGTVYETFLDNNPQLGSVCSGGRYDNLAGCYIDRPLPGVGISIGLTRLFCQLLDMGLIKTEQVACDRLLVIPMDNDIEYAVQIANAIRALGISTQIYLERDKVKKKFSFANKQQNNFVVIVGEEEKKQKTFSVKNFLTGEQQTYSLNMLEEVLLKLITTK